MHTHQRLRTVDARCVVQVKKLFTVILLRKFILAQLLAQERLPHVRHGATDLQATRGSSFALQTTVRRRNRSRKFRHAICAHHKDLRLRLRIGAVGVCACERSQQSAALTIKQ